MKRILLAFVFLIITASSFAQCSTCTIYITGTDVADHFITIGQIMCVEPGATVTGRIYVSSGGIVCNQGHINSPDIYVGGGGELDNYGIANIDTIYIIDPSAVLRNYGTMTNNILGVQSEATLTNNGAITTGFYWDTAAIFINNGNFTVTQDIYIGTNTRFTNNQSFIVKRDFYNGVNATFTTSCMATVQRNWYNSGKIDGPATGCGGFRITGQSYNSGTVGDTGHVDICEAGHPAGGVDGNSGILTGVTFCQCADSCNALPLGIVHGADTESSFSVFPNPASDRLQIRFTNETEAVIVLQNLLGEEIQRSTVAIGSKELTLNTSALASGSYILTVVADGVRASSKIEIVR